MTTTQPRPVPSRTTRARTLRATVGAALLLAAAAATAPHAEAAPVSAPVSAPTVEPAPHRVVHLDATGDVVGWGSDTDIDAATPAPARTSTDIVRTVIDHRAHRLTTVVELAEVDRSAHRFLMSRVRTGSGAPYDVMLDYSRRPSFGDRITVSSSTVGSVDCGAATWSVDEAASEVQLSVPRSCLGDPAQVEVAVAAASFSRHWGRVHGDDSRRDTSAADHLALGPVQPHA